MTEIADIHVLTPVLPELILACGAMRHADARRLCRRAQRQCRQRLSILILAAAGAAIVWLPGGKATMFGGSFVVDEFARFLKLLALDRLGGALVLSLELPCPREPAEVRVRRAVPAVDARHADADFGRRPDRALSRPRADEPAALRRGGIQPRQCQVDGSRPEVFRARRAVVGHAALWRVADLRLHRHHQLCRHRQGDAAAPGSA